MAVSSDSQTFLVIFCDSLWPEKAEGILALHDCERGMILEPINPRFVHANDSHCQLKGVRFLKELSVFKNGVLFVIIHAYTIREDGPKVKLFANFFSLFLCPVFALIPPHQLDN